MGALIGGIAGLLLTRHWLGGVFGALAGWLLAALWQSSLLHSRRLPTTTSVFAVLGRMAKVDGRVDEAEVAFVDQLMRRLALDNAGRRMAVNAFQRGKQAGADLADDYGELREARRHAPALIDVFIGLALADGRLDPAERQLLGRVAQALGVREAALEVMLARHRAARSDRASDQSDSYAVLGVSHDASDVEVRRAFRRLMSRHHPDKLAASGAARHEVRLAQERTQAILAAYEAIKAGRAMKS